MNFLFLPLLTENPDFFHDALSRNYLRTLVSTAQWYHSSPVISHGVFSDGICSILWPAEGAVYSANPCRILPLQIFRVRVAERVGEDVPGGLGKLKDI